MKHTVSREISDDGLNKIMTIESNGNPTIKAKTSSATGFGQFLNQTWLGTLKKHGPKSLADRIIKRGSRWIVPDGGEQQILNMRKATTPALKKLNIDMLARFAEDNAHVIGAGFTDGDLYLAHFLGAGAAKKLFHAVQGADVEPLVGEAAVHANETILRGKTVAQVRRWSQNSMDTRWAKAGKPDWIKKFYSTGEGVELPDVPIPKPRPDIASDDDPDLPTKVPEMIDRDHDGIPDEVDTDIEVSEVEVPALPPVNTSVRGDPEIWNIQRRLKDMNYNPGGLDGRWGGMTAEAISGFLNDWPGAEFAAPTSLEMFNRVREKVKAELTKAESVAFKRPVAEERKNADQKKVEEVAPEAKPVNQSYFATKWAAFLGMLATMWATVKDQVSNAWDFFTGHRDDLPDADSGIMQTLLGYISSVPLAVWFALGTAGIVVVALRLHKASSDITAQVQTGVRK